MKVAEPTQDCEGHVIATRYLHDGRVYTARASICTLKDTSTLLEVEVGDVVSCETCAIRLEEARTNEGRFAYHPPAPVHEPPPPATPEERNAATELADALLASGVDIDALLNALKKGP
jgi:hypothetical protein